MVHADDGMPYCHVQENFGPWQVMLKQTDNSYACVVESETRFTLNEEFVWHMQTKEELLRVLGLKEEQGSQLEFLRRGY
ncbi:low PSII Accumulation 3 [Artemisia annua]|uniref:Low PSII Accumulation 3 n=1 Tax=Artemisia annua TaxID=35608 RepID=A0A2U1LQN5_ARTAN|nr:low PSII Accumulation 3 [Artemisia annua]